jgi:hypothetical protein
VKRLLALLLFGLAACGAQVAANDLEVGDCIEEEEDITGAVDSVPTIDCEEDHVAEVVGKFEVEGEEFPGEAELETEAEEGCREAFEEHTGEPPGAAFRIEFLTPTEESWDDADDRTIICLGLSADGDPLTESIEADETGD